MSIFSIPHIKVTGLSVVVPPGVEKNGDLPFLNDEDKQRLIQTTGIEKRRIASDSITAADLCIQSAEDLISDLGWSKDEIELIVFVTQTPDFIIPGTSMFIQQSLGLTNDCLAIDINQGCAGYVYGMSVVASMMSAGKIKKGLLLVGDTITKTIDKNDQSLIPIFSDAGSCTSLEYSEFASSIHFNLQTDGTGYDKIIVKGGGARISSQPAAGYLYMNGQDIFNFGLKEVAPNVQKLLSANKTNIQEIDYFVMHQANLLLNETIRKKVGMELSETLYSIKDYGNTSCASIPVSIAAHANRVINGNYKLLLAGFGVGLSWGSMIVDFDNINCRQINEYK